MKRLTAVLITGMLMAGFMLAAVPGTEAATPIAVTSSPVVIAYPGLAYSYNMTFNKPADLIITDNHLSVGLVATQYNWVTANASILISGTLSALGNYYQTLTVYDYSSGTFTTQNWTIHVVVPTWTPHVTNSPPLVGFLGHVYAWQIALNESGAITWNGGNWLEYSQSDQLYLHGMPTSVGVVNMSIKIWTVTFNGPVTYYNWTINVSAAAPPIFTNAPNTTGTVGIPYSYTPIMSPSANVTFELPTAPYWLSWNGTTLNGTPPLGSNGTYYLHMTAVLSLGDGQVEKGYLNWVLVIGTLPVPGFTSIPILSMVVGDAFSYTPTCNMSCTFSIIQEPSWASLTAGTVSGRPGSIGYYHFTIKATSTLYGTSSYQAFDVKVNPAVWPTIAMQPVWFYIIPLVIIIMVCLISSVSKDGLSITLMLSSAAIAIAAMTWANIFPVWTLIISAVILVLLIFRAQDTNKVMQNG